MIGLVSCRVDIRRVMLRSGGLSKSEEGMRVE
jgi:hypothetical protein